MLLLGYSLYIRSEVNELAKSDEVAKRDRVLRRYVRQERAV